jgi:preprotein translocase subunit YajC
MTMIDFLFPGIAHAQAAAQEPGAGQRMLLQMVLILGFVLVFYFLLLRPQQKRQRAVQEMIKGLKTGDRVLTTGGLFGQVLGVKDDVVVLKIADDVKVEVAKSAVTGVVAKS